MSPQRITQRHDAAYRRAELFDEIPHKPQMAVPGNGEGKVPGHSYRQTPGATIGVAPGRCDNPEHLRTNAESLLLSYRRNQRRSARFWLVLFCVPFSAAAWFLCLWLTRHFLR